MDKHNAQEVQEPARAPEVLELTAAAINNDLRALDILAYTLELPEKIQLDTFIDKFAEYAQEAQEPTGEQLAFSLPDYSPELDPAGAAFNPAAYRQAIAEAGGWQTFKAELLDREELRDFYGRFMDAHRAAAEAFKNSPGAKAAAEASKGLAKAMKNSQRMQEVARASQVIHKALLEALKTPEMQARLQEVQKIAEETEKLRNKYEPYFIEAWPKFAEAPNFIKDVAYSLILELDIAQAAGQFKGVTVPEVLDAGYNSEWEKIEGSPFFDLLTVAERGAALFPTLDRLQALQKALETAEHRQEIDPDQITLDSLFIGTDKISQLATTPRNYQSVFSYDMELGGNIPNAQISIYDENIKEALSKPITARQWQLLTAAYNLQKAGARKVTISQLAHEMGLKGTISGKTLEELLQDMEYLATVRVRIVQDAFTGKDKKEREKHCDIDYLLPFGFHGTAKQGAITKAVYEFYEPKSRSFEDGGPFLAMADRLNQISRVPRAAFQTPSRKNEATYRREQYFMVRVARSLRDQRDPRKKKDPRYKKIRYNSYFEKYDITDKKQRAREKKYILELFEYWQSIDYIGSFEKEKDGLLIFPPKEK